MGVTLDDLDLRLKAIDGALRLRSTGTPEEETGGRNSSAPRQSDPLRLRWGRGSERQPLL